MNYKESGKSFCNEIVRMLETENLKASFVTGGGFAYDSLKYNDDNVIGDFDFMIVYDDYLTLDSVISGLKQTNYKFEEKYLDLDLKLLKNKDIDIIRLCGTYNEIKSTINLVPASLIRSICNFEGKIIIKKIAHNRNTSLFFAYGSDDSRIIVNFISPSFITNDGEDHYVHLDFSYIENNHNIYFGILADAILKGFNKNYDRLDFSLLRETFIKNIHNYFKNNNINTSSYLKLFANNSYFPTYLKENLLAEFEKYGKMEGIEDQTNINEPIVLTVDFNTDYEKNSFNFINNKKYNMSFIDYVKKMQNTEYDRQYLLDALGKFYGYLMSSSGGMDIYSNENIFLEIEVFGTNDLYFKDASKYTIDSIIDSFIRNLIKDKAKYNNILVSDFLMISIKFLSYITSENIETILKKYNQKNLFNSSLNSKNMDINIILNIDSFNELGTYHNFTSKVMPIYTDTECKFLNDRFYGNKDKKILDIMCGYGRIANRLKQLGYKNIYGIDSENYEFLHVPKDFTFINDDYLQHEFNNHFDFVYSLYNCFDSIDYMGKIFDKTYSILTDGGVFIADCFNKQWRDNVAPDFEKVLYKDDNYTLIIKRDYDSKTANEITWYELYYKTQKIKEYEYVQKFFSCNEILEVIDSSKWNVNISDSLQLQSRTNAQKHVMVLGKK